MDKFYKVLPVEDKSMSVSDLLAQEDAMEHSAVVVAFDSSEEGSSEKKRFRHDMKNAILRVTRLRNLIRDNRKMTEEELDEVVIALDETEEDLGRLKQFLKDIL